MSALTLLEDQRKEMHLALKRLLKTGELTVEEEDFEKTEYLLQLHPKMMSVIESYEWSQENPENGMSQFELMNAEGYARRGEHGRELVSDVTANSAVLKEKSAATFQLYKTISNTICVIIDNLKDPHMRAMFNMLFVEGKRPQEVMGYLEEGYSKELFAIGTTTCWDKRRKGIRIVTASLKLAGVLEVVKEDERESRIKKHIVYRMVYSEWDN